MTDREPFLTVVAMSREDAEEWAEPGPCYAVEYVGQASGTRFGAKRYRVWLVAPSEDLRRKWIT